MSAVLVAIVLAGGAIYAFCRLLIGLSAVVTREMAALEDSYYQD